MPKIEVNRKLFFERVGKKLALEDLVDLLECAKAELDGVLEEQDVLKIELNDTNRPDLWSTMGLARQLAAYLGGAEKKYDFFSTPEKAAPTGGKRVIVDKKLQHIRPFIAAFVAAGTPVDEPRLVDMIQSQEKLCGNFGSKRKSIAMGIYRSDIIAYPVRY
ncbi:MAG TPA: phenylalanine--tRNA ligase subunit beta, partial [Spirochaetia bacterium]|nr:phenylalanine--tRNA ligase subunit beta [Spirochaetia bacterium]